MDAHHYNPSVSFADSSPYTEEPLARTASGRAPRNDTERRRAKTITHILRTTWLSALPTNSQFAALLRKADNQTKPLCRLAKGLYFSCSECS